MTIRQNFNEDKGFEKKDVFLGGTTNNSNWRDRLEILLKERGITFFNPVVDDWNDDAYELELRHREESKFVLYVITPKMLGSYAIAEVVVDSNKRPNKTIFMILDKDDSKVFNERVRKALDKVSQMIKDNGSFVVKTFEEIVDIVR